MAKTSKPSPEAGNKHAPKHAWAFRSRFRSGAYGWKASHLACQRIKEAVSEIKTVARRDAIEAGEGAIIFLGRIWPALQYVDSSSGALSTAVNHAQEELLPLLISAPAPALTRQGWLERLYQALQEDGVQYLWLVEEQWGAICGSVEVASLWADRFLPIVRQVWSRPDSGFLSVGASLCLSCLLAAGRHQELWELLALERLLFWPYRKFGVQAFVKEGRVDEALAYAEAARGLNQLNQPQAEIDAACEQIVLDAGRSDEAYERYGLSARLAASATTGLATFRAIVKKYPQRDRRQILTDLVRSSGEPGRWFAAAKAAGFLDLALQLAKEGQTDPRTLIRAARDFGACDPAFALAVGCLALERMLQGYGYELTGAEMLGAYEHCITAATALDKVAQTQSEILALVTQQRVNQPRMTGARGEVRSDVGILAEQLLRHIRAARHSAQNAAPCSTQSAVTPQPPATSQTKSTPQSPIARPRRRKPNPLRLM